MPRPLSAPRSKASRFLVPAMCVLRAGDSDYGKSQPAAATDGGEAVVAFPESASMMRPRPLPLRRCRGWRLTGKSRSICCPVSSRPDGCRAASRWSSTCCGRRRRSFTLWRAGCVAVLALSPRSRRRASLADGMRAGRVLLGGERGGVPLARLRPRQLTRRIHLPPLQGHHAGSDHDQRHARLAAAAARPSACWWPGSSITAPSANNWCRIASCSYRLRRHHGDVDAGRHSARRGPGRVPVRARAGAR